MLNEMTKRLFSVALWVVSLWLLPTAGAQSADEVKVDYSIDPEYRIVASEGETDKVRKVRLLQDENQLLWKFFQKKGVNICIASGDRQEKLEAVAARLAVPKENVFGAASPEKKADVICSLQNTSETVIMIGDAVNDLPAFHAADFAVLTVQQRGRRPDILFDAADAVIEDIRDAEEIVRRFL